MAVQAAGENCRCRKNRLFGSDDSGIFREILFVWACSGWPGEIHLSENQRVDCGIQEVGYYDAAYIQYDENVQKGKFTEYDNTILLVDERPATGQYEILPGGRYITAYHVGHWMNIGQTYERLLQYKEQHHLKTESFYIERYVVDNFIAKEIEDYVTEVAVRILDASDR